MPVPALSQIEQEVVLLVAEGRRPQEIAITLSLSVKTIEWHIARARRKLEHAASLHDRVQEAESRPADIERRES